ncbi:MAG: hypothetical protein NVSMB62_08390 [Acidobacteriaceae bacterium]
MRRIVTTFVLLAGLALPVAAQTTTSACSAISLGDLGSLNGWVPSPNDAWHQDISNLAVDPSSDKIITTPGDLANRFLHPDFSNVVDGAYGIPYTVIDSTKIPFVPITPYDVGDSDNTLYPITANTPIEGSPGQCWTDGNYDHHAIIIDRTTCVSYEIYQADLCSGQWSSYGNVIWDFTLPSGEKRPYGVSSVDAAGLSVFEGLIRYDEIVAGQINHAIRFTAVHTKQDNANGYFTAPATHAAGNLWGTDNIMGMRIRLKASFDVSKYSQTNQIILNAMKKYGMILADNGGDMFFQGTPDPHWDDNDLGALKQVPSSAFEVVKMNPVYDAYTAPAGPAPAITSFTASANNVAPGTPVTLTPSVTNGSYEFIDNAGFTRGPVTVSPNCTTTYTLYSRNEFDTSTSSVTVNVTGGSTSACTTAPPSGGSGNTPSLVFTPVGMHNYPTPPFSVSATSNSPGAITFVVVSGPATVSGNTVTLSGTGTVVLEADQAASGNFNAASTQMTFSVGSSVTTLLQFNTIADQLLGAAPFPVSATSNSPGTITYAVLFGPASLQGNVLTVTGVGHVVLVASQAASGFFPTATALATFNVTATSSTPTLTFNTVPGKSFGAAPFSVSATSNSTGAITYSVVSGPATISGNTVTVTGVGTITLKAAQAAAGAYSAATASTAFTVSAIAPTLSFNAVPNQTFGTAPFTISASSNSTGTITYSIASGPATIAGNTVTLSGTGSVTLKAAQAAAGNYNSETVYTSFNISGTAPTLSFNSIANQAFGTAPFTVSASSNSQGAITYSVLSGPATLSGSTVTLTGAGSVTLLASQAANAGYSAATASTSFTVSGTAPSLSFNAVANQTFGAAPFAVSATSNSTGAITYTVSSGPATISGNSVTLTGSGTVVLQASQAAAGGFTSATTNTSFSVAGATPALSFSPVGNQIMGAVPFAVSATSNSTGTVTYTVVNGPATISGNAVTVTGVGTVTLQASQAAAGGYSAASANTSFTVSGAGPSLVFNQVANQTFGAAPFAVSATSNSTSAISYSVLGGPATLSGNIVTLTGAGTVVLQASQAASSSYVAAAVTTSFTASNAASNLSFGPIANQTFGATPFAVTASSNSPGAITYSILSGPATLSGTVVSLTGTGTVTLQASQAAATGFAAATASTSFNVSAVIPTLTFQSIATQAFGAAPFAVSASSNSTGAITYSVVSGPAIIAGNVLTINGAGTVVVQANQAATTGYASASANTSFNITAVTPTVSLGTIPGQTFGAAPFSINATSNSPGAISYTIVSGPATIAGNTVTLSGPGTVTLQASQAASAGYGAAVASTSFSVAALSPSLTFNGVPTQTFGAAPFAISANSNSNGAITYLVLSGPASISGNVVSLTGSGSVTIQASQAANGGYAAATAVTSFTVNSAGTGLTIGTIAAQSFGGPPVPLSATSNSPGAITWTVLSGPAVILGNSVSFTAAGPVTLQATQAAAGNFLPATVTTSFTITPALPNLSITSIPTQTFGSGPLTLTANSNSNTPITYTVLSGPATVNGNTLTLNGTGSITVQAAQPASGNYLAGAAVTSFTISPSSVVLAGDFAMPNNITITMNQGDSRSVTVPLSAVNGFNGIVSLHCSVPAAMTFGACNSTTAQVTASNATGANLTVSTRGPVTTAEDHGSPLHPMTTGLVFLGCLLPCGLPLFSRRKINLRRLSLGLLLALSLGAVSLTTTGCGMTILNAFTPAGTYVLHVDAASGPAAHAMTITVIVQQPKN